LVPGYTFLGFPLPSSERLYYKVNGLRCFIITLGSFFAAIYYGYLDEPLIAKIVNDWGRIIVAFNLFSFINALFMYFKGLLFKQGNPSGNIIIDYFYGYEPNPRIFNIIWTDLKWFLEGRALIFWIINALLLAYRQYTLLGYVTNTMTLAVFLHFWYVTHYFVVETNVLSMVDFTGDHMGWMLGWGNGVLVPFAYSLPEWYALKHPVQTSVGYIVFILVIHTLGYTIFAQSNLQKKQFKENPNAPIWGNAPKVLKTVNGRNLLYSGWWGVARHMNYTGDLIQAYCFGFATFPFNFFSIIPFTNGIFLTAVTIQRETRDNAWCQAKYGDDWNKYCKLVPYRMIPYVY